MRSSRKSKSGLRKRFILKTQENCVGSISSTPEDTEFKETIKNARMKLEIPVAPAMPCTNYEELWEWCIQQKSNKNLRVFWKLMNPPECVWETRYRKITKDHIAGKGNNSLQHYNLVHKFIPMPQAIEKFWQRKQRWTRNGKNGEFRSWNLTKVKSKKDVIDEARTSGATVHFASLMDICHLKNAELEAKHQKYKGRVVLRGDILKDNSGSYAVFTEQGSSAS